MSDFNYREHRYAYVEQDEDLKLKRKYMSAAALNPFIEHNSSPRGLMMSLHIAQLVVLNKSEENIVQSGLEKELAKYTTAVVAENDLEVINVIKRYNILGEDDKVVGYTLIVRNIDTGELDAIEIPMFNKFHPYFGYKYKIDEEVSTFVRGDIIEKGINLATPPTIIDENSYGFGRNINVVHMSLPEVDEDGFIISESACKKFGFKIFDNRTIEVGENSFLLNLYGDDENYKPFPEIGEHINDTGVVVAARKYDQKYGPALYGKDDIKTFNPMFDEAVYTRGKNSKVIDIKIYYNPRKKRSLPEGTDRYCFKYSDALLSYYQQLIITYENMQNEYTKVFNKNLPVGNKLNTLLVEAYGILDSSFIGTKFKKNYRKEILDLFRIEFELEHSIERIGVGYKLTGLAGDKGTIVEVWPDENMPVDKDGNRAELIMDSKSTISRLNVGRLYEHYIKGSTLKINKIIRDTFKSFNKSEVYELSDNELIQLFRHIVDYINTINEKTYKVYFNILKNNDRENMINILEEVINDGIKIYLSVDDDKRKYEIVEDLRNSIYAPIEDNVRFIYNNKEQITKDKVLIAPMYIFLLSKIADNSLSTSSAKVNHFSIPVVSSRADKYRYPTKNSPVRTQGETEQRVFVAYGGRKFAAEMKNLNTSLISHREAYKNILIANKPTNINNIIDRSKIDYDSESPSMILESLWNSIGMELKYVPESNRYFKYTKIKDDEVVDINDISDIDDIEEDEGVV